MIEAAAAMFEPLSAEERGATGASGPASTKTPIIPVPPYAPPFSFRHPKFGQPTKAWPYHDATGALVAYAARFDFVTATGEPDKEVWPICFCEISGDRPTHAWRSKGVPSPRPLYRLPQLIAEQSKPVLFVEGEKKAEAGAVLFADHVVIGIAKLTQTATRI